ncbi:MAG: hypothetical protein RLZZ387_2987 [Chloroflexota bacterium]|jgi:DNA-binding NarL/FixJ family response regulator
MSEVSPPMTTMTATPTPRATRLLIADDHDLARAGLRSLVNGVTDIEVVGEATSGLEALSMCHALQPDVVLMDVRMPDMDGLAATAALKHEFPHVIVLIVTMYETPEYLLMALRAGASGYLLKDMKRSSLIAAIHQVIRGESFLNSDLVTRVLRQLNGDAPSHERRQSERLTVRELEVVRLLAQGKTNREIGRQLVISTGTVKVHVEHIIAKLEVSDRTQAAVRAIQLGLIQPSET